MKITVKEFVPRAAKPTAPDAVFGGYNHEQLAAAFAKVRDKRDWKNPISAVIDESDMDAVSAAIAFFTGSAADFAPAKGGKLRVRASGYYSAIGS